MIDKKLRINFMSAYDLTVDNGYRVVDKFLEDLSSKTPLRLEVFYADGRLYGTYHNGHLEVGQEP